MMLTRGMKRFATFAWVASVTPALGCVSPVTLAREGRPFEACESLNDAPDQRSAVLRVWTPQVATTVHMKVLNHDETRRLIGEKDRYERTEFSAGRAWIAQITLDVERAPARLSFSVRTSRKGRYEVVRGADLDNLLHAPRERASYKSCGGLLDGFILPCKPKTVRPVDPPEARNHPMRRARYRLQEKLLDVVTAAPGSTEQGYIVLAPGKGNLVPVGDTSELKYRVEYTEPSMLHYDAHFAPRRGDSRCFVHARLRADIELPASLDGFRNATAALNAY